jgi:hypothetical protein
VVPLPGPYRMLQLRVSGSGAKGTASLGVFRLYFYIIIILYYFIYAYVLQLILCVTDIS